jgi:hypothetical protein
MQTGAQLPSQHVAMMCCANSATNEALPTPAYQVAAEDAHGGTGHTYRCAAQRQSSHMLLLQMILQLTECIDVARAPSPAVMVVQDVGCEEVGYGHELQREVKQQQKHGEAAAEA